MNFYVFSIRGIPVHLSVWALALVAWLAWSWGDPVQGALVGVGAILSVLIHELGHAVVAARYGLQPSILLHALGGTTQHLRARTDGQDAWIIAAGPLIQIGAGFVAMLGWIGAALLVPAVAAQPLFAGFMTGFLYVSLIWGAINLAPMWPLDGGKLFRLALLHLLRVKPVRADQVTHVVGMGLAIATLLGFWLLVPGSGFLVLVIFGMVAFQNFMALREGRAAGPVRPRSDHADGLLDDARNAFARRDWPEAARIGHQIRAEPNVPDKVLAEALELLTLAHIYDGALGEGVRFARLAPPTPRLVSAWVQALIELDRAADARRVLADHGASLPPTLRAELALRLAD
jgi:stage IV sporulation protein FB